MSPPASLLFAIAVMLTVGAACAGPARADRAYVYDSHESGAAITRLVPSLHSGRLTFDAATLATRR